MNMEVLEKGINTKFSVSSIYPVRAILTSNLFGKVDASPNQKNKPVANFQKG